VTTDLERRIDELYALPLDRFTPERDALAKELRGAGDRGAADRVKTLRKPVVVAWALNLLAREDPEAVEQLLELGTRLREAQRRAISGGDVEPLRAATDERRRLVARLVGSARSILDREGAGGASLDDDLEATLDAAAVDEEAGSQLRAGRLTRPLRPPTGFGETAALRVVQGGRGRAARDDAPPEERDDRGRDRRIKELRRELAAAEKEESRATAALDRARKALEELDRRRAEARERIRSAETERRGAALEARRLSATLRKLDR
jgi:hypothetical protein